MFLEIEKGIFATLAKVSISGVGMNLASIST